MLRRFFFLAKADAIRKRVSAGTVHALANNLLWYQKKKKKSGQIVYLLYCTASPLEFGLSGVAKAE